MRNYTGLLGLVLVGTLMLGGCASMRGAKKDTTQSDRLAEIEVRLSGLESMQSEMREELRTITGLQQGLQQQLNALSRQQPAGTPDEK